MWKKSNSVEEDPENKNDALENEYEITKTVPWEFEDQDNFVVALNGKTLAFLHQNQDKYGPVLHKVL